MNLKRVSEHLNKLSSVTSSNAKVDYLKANRDDEDLKEFFKLALDQRHNFYITPPKELPAPGLTIVYPTSDLERLTSRSITGNDAKSFLVNTLKYLTEESQQVLVRILNRDARCGTNVSAVNKVWPGLVFEYDLMKGESLNDYPVGKKYKCPWSGKEKVIARVGRRASGKLDGRRNESQRLGNTFQFLSSSGRPVNLGDKAIPELITLPIPDGWYLDSELCDSDWNASMSVTAAGNKSDTWSLQVFGLWSPDERWGKVFTTNAEMEIRMKSIIGEGTRHIKIAKDYGIPNTEEEAEAMQNQAFEDGLEGIMWKEMDAPYLAYRSPAWLKAKAEETIDVQVVDLEEGEQGKKYQGTMGAFVVEDSNGIRFNVGIGKGGSLTDKVRGEMWAKRATVVGSYIEILQDKVRDPSKIVSRFARFVRMRTDK